MDWKLKWKDSLADEDDLRIPHREVHKSTALDQYIKRNLPLLKWMRTKKELSDIILDPAYD
jgi:hypothetical protein